MARAIKITGFLLIICLNITKGDYSNILAKIHKSANQNRRPLVLVLDNNSKSNHKSRSSYDSRHASNLNDDYHYKNDDYRYKKNDYKYKTDGYRYKKDDYRYKKDDELNRNYYGHNIKPSYNKASKSALNKYLQQFLRIKAGRSSEATSRSRYDSRERHSHSQYRNENYGHSHGQEKYDSQGKYDSHGHYNNQWKHNSHEHSDHHNLDVYNQQQERYDSHGRPDSQGKYDSHGHYINQGRHESHEHYNHLNVDVYSQKQGRYGSHGHPDSQAKYDRQERHDSHEHSDHSNVDVYSQKHYHDAHFHPNNEPGYSHNNFQLYHKGSYDHKYHGEHYRQGKPTRGLKGDKDLTRTRTQLKKYLRSPVVRTLLRISNDIQCEAKDECLIECNYRSDCMNDCEAKFECQDEKQIDECERQECENSNEIDNPSTKGIPVEGNISDDNGCADENSSCYNK